MFVSIAACQYQYVYLHSNVYIYCSRDILVFLRVFLCTCVLLWEWLHACVRTCSLFCVAVCLCIYVCVCVKMCTFIGVGICLNISVYFCVCECFWESGCMFLCACVYLHVWLYVCRSLLYMFVVVVVFYCIDFFFQRKCFLAVVDCIHLDLACVNLHECVYIYIYRCGCICPYIDVYLCSRKCVGVSFIRFIRF